MSRHIVLDSTPTAASGQLVTAVTARPVNSSYDFGLWRVDRVTSWLASYIITTHVTQLTWQWQQ